MDDRTEPERPRWVGFRTNADDTFRPIPAYEPGLAEPERADAWGPELSIRYDETPDRAPAGVAARRSGGMGSSLGIGAMALAAAAIGFLLAPDLSGRGDRADRPAEPAGAASPSEGAARDQGLEGARGEAPAAADRRGPESSGAGLRGAVASSPAPPAAEREVVRAAGGEAPVRVFVHIADPAQEAAADRVQAELRALRFADQPVATPPVRYVASSPRRTEVRCLKAADCAAARGVARHLEQALGTPVSVLDVSARYEGDRRVRRGSLELWLAP